MQRQTRIGWIGTVVVTGKGSLLLKLRDAF